MPIPVSKTQAFSPCDVLEACEACEMAQKLSASPYADQAMGGTSASSVAIGPLAVAGIHANGLLSRRDKRTSGINPSPPICDCN